MRAISSQSTIPKPSALLALVCASVVASFDPSWLSASVGERASDEGVRPERVSRLKKRLLGPFLALLGAASTRGRKARPRPSDEVLPAVLAQELLTIAADVIASLGVCKRSLQDRLVAARNRLKTQYGLSYAKFCTSLGLCERNLRNWAQRKPKRPSPPRTPEPPPDTPDRSRRGRFDLDRLLPGIQVAADTSNFELFGVPLKIVAAQDVGDRDRELWRDFAVDDHEDHELVLKVVEAALGDRPGSQLVTDQGTPYLADAASEAYANLEIEHAPQKEGAPTEKATLERSFRTVKVAIQPLVSFLDALAKLVPALATADCARAVAALLLSAYLRVYRLAERKGGARSDPPHREVLLALAEEQREQARAETRSVKLFLEHVHDLYQLEGSRAHFVRSCRNYPLEVLQDTERRFRDRAHYARHAARYFVGILRNVNEAHQRRRRLRRDEIHRQDEERRMAQDREALHDLFAAEPEHWVAHALEFLETQYLPDRQALLFEGKGPGRAHLRHALQRIAELHPVHAVALDRAETGWNYWLKETEAPEPARQLIRRLFEDFLAQYLPDRAPPSTPDLVADILRNGSP